MHSKGFRIFSDGKIRVERHVRFLSCDTNDADSAVPSNSTTNLSDQPILSPTSPQPPRRSERLRLLQAHNTSSETPYEPKTYKQAISCPDKDKWILAMEEELRSIIDNQTWSPVDLPKGRDAIGCRWVLKIKEGDSTTEARYKARLVAQGFTQKFGVDFDEVFAPVTRSSTFRTLLTIASHKNLVVQQYDVKTAFSNGTLEEEIFMKPPPNS
jgi:Reverse transcriptase (RNA-dependent DNA polymerase)